MDEKITAMQSTGGSCSDNLAEEFYTVKEAAKALNKPPATLWSAVYAGTLKVRRTNGENPRIARAELDRYALTLPRALKRRYKGRELEILKSIEENSGDICSPQVLSRFGAENIDVVAWTRFVKKIDREFNFRLSRPGSDCKGGSRQLWLRSFRDKIIEHYEKHGREKTLWHFKIGSDTLDRVLSDELPKPYGPPFTKTDELELRISGLHEEAISLREEVSELKRAFNLFQQGVATDITQKFLMPLLKAGIQLDEKIEGLAESDALSLVDVS